MNNSDIPEYLRDLTREERALILRYRLMNEKEQRQLLEKADKYIKEQSVIECENE